MTDPQRPRTTPEGHTPEDPRPAELGKRGTPGAGMTPEVPHVADARELEEAGAADETAHADSHATVDDDHAHAEPRLGPIHWRAWGFAALGVAAGLIVVALFYVAIT